MTPLLNPTDELLSLEAFAVDGLANEGAKTSPQDLECTARAWGRRFRILGNALRSQGYSVSVKSVTIGRPMDHAAIEVLHLACGILDDNENSPEFLNLVDLLSNYLGTGAADRKRFQEALHNVLRRVRSFRF